MGMGSSGRRLKKKRDGMGIERASIGAHQTRVQVQSAALKDGFVAAALRTTFC